MNTPALAHSNPLAESWAVSLRNVDSGGGPEWLQALRSCAANEFLQHGLPGNKDEAWKYTSLRRLENLQPGIEPGDQGAISSAWIAPPPSVEGFGFRFTNGRVEWLEKITPQGVSMRPLNELLSETDLLQPDRLRPLLEAVDIQGRSRAFEALNTALLNDGVVIHVAAGVDAGNCLVQWQQGGHSPSRLANFRLILLLETGASLSLFEQFRGVGTGEVEPATGSAMNLVLQADLAGDSTLNHVRVQNDSAENILLTFSDIQQASGSSYQYTGFDLGGALVRHDIRCSLAGAGASAEINGAFVVDGERHVDHHVCIDHLAPSCSSEQFFRGVLGGRGRGVFNGKSLIRPGADGSKVRQSNANLLLSELAEMDTKPELEIYADEVEASHGATVGQLDEQAVFYLRTRGLAEADARRMLTSAFCRTVTARLADRQLAEQVNGMLDAAMPRHSGEGDQS